MEKHIEPGAASKKKSKEDEDLLELAEEVLNSSDDEIIGLDEDAVVTAVEDDDVIDLTDVSEPPLTDDDDEILDLTEELQQGDEEDDITIAEDDEIMELEDITDVSADTEVAILELDEAIDALAEPKEEILVAEDVAGDAEETIIDLQDTVEEGAADREPVAAGSAFSIETDTVELTDSDRETLEQDFGFEDEDGGLAESTPVEGEPLEEGFPAGSREDDLDDTVELTGPVGDAAASPVEQPPAYPQEPFELTDEDRQTLEEEIGADTIEEITAGLEDTTEPLPMEEDSAAALAEQVQELPGEPAEPIAAESLEAELHLDAPDWVSEETGEGQPEPEPGAEAEIRFDAEELSMEDDADEEPIDLGMFPELEGVESTSDQADALQQTVELADVNGEALQAEIDGEADEPAFSTDEEREEPIEEILDVGLDDEPSQLADEPAAAEIDASLAVEGLGLTDEPEVEMAETDDSGSDPFTIESPADAPEEETPLDAEALTEADAGLVYGPDVSGDTPSGTTFDPEEDEAAPEITGATSNGMSVDFDHAESFEQTDMHKDADPISIRVKEPAIEDHADEDALLDKVFEPQPDAVSPQDLEQTVERVVGKMLSGKIETILADAIEKAVEKEIGRLKQLLLEDLDRLE